ncbi:MAG: arylsulfatase [Gemmatimonadota bacterium]
MTNLGFAVRSLLQGKCLMPGLLLVAACSAPPEPAGPPNILLIVADDMGYADLGAFGSDIRTPNIDALAAEGIIFTRFHTAPLCSPTRSMLLSGNNNHVAGIGDQGVSLDTPGYEGHLSDRVMPFPRLLRDAGYHTYTAGKWHLGNALEHGPASAGFERSFSYRTGGPNHFGVIGMVEGGPLYTQDGARAEFPEGGYSTEVFTDRLIEFIDSNAGDGRPFFAFAAYTSPHWPLQVPDEYLDLYAGQYDQGYDRLREERFESLKTAGIVPRDWSMPPRNEAVTPWTELDAEERRTEARKMELYAALLENLDDHVGRLIEHLKASGLYENTMIVFMSDNGPDGNDFFARGPFSEYLQAHYDNSYENMGRVTSWVSYDRPWAEAGSAPFSRYKQYTREGGISSAMIVSGAGVPRRGEIDRSYLTVMDLAPTFLEVAGARYPSDGSVWPMLGESMLARLSDSTRSTHSEDYVTTFFHRGRAYVREGPWKLVNMDGPLDEADFELFDVEADPGETRDLAAVEPERYVRMIELWREKRQELGILLLEER